MDDGNKLYLGRYRNVRRPPYPDAAHPRLGSQVRRQFGELVRLHEGARAQSLEGATGYVHGPLDARRSVHLSGRAASNVYAGKR